MTFDSQKSKLALELREQIHKTYLEKYKMPVSMTTIRAVVNYILDNFEIVRKEKERESLLNELKEEFENLPTGTIRKAAMRIKKIWLGGKNYSYCLAVDVDGNEVELHFKKSIAGITADEDLANKIVAALSAPAEPFIHIEFVKFEENGVRLKTPYHEFIVETPKQTPAVPVIEGLDEAIDKYDSGDLCNTGGKYNDLAWQAARAHAALPKMQKVDLDALREDSDPGNDPWEQGHYVGVNGTIDTIKSKYGELYAEVKE